MEKEVEATIRAIPYLEAEICDLKWEENRLIQDLTTVQGALAYKEDILEGLKNKLLYLRNR